MAITVGLQKQRLGPMGCEQVLVKELRERGMRVTPQREMVLAALHDLHGHAAVDDIFQVVRSRSSSVDKTTVYRTLELLRELGLVHEVDVGDSVLRYELSLHGEHGHLLCTGCGRLLTFDCADLSQLRRALEREHGFDVQAEHQVLRGLCAACRTMRAEATAPQSALTD